MNQPVAVLTPARTVGRVVALLWVVIPPLVLSALVHMTDPDIDGWAGLTSSTVLVSVVLFGAVAAGCVAFTLAVFVGFGGLAFLVVAGLFSLCSGAMLTVAGSGATTTAGVLWSGVGSSVVVFFTVLMAVLPARQLGWSRTPPDNGGGHTRDGAWNGGRA